ncbi:MAG: phosphate ABC transporter permease subunit PstC [Akkermansia sp.]|nr:phosphate ABC transporter permease subunit PstC [Akkermansia sp.]
MQQTDTIFRIICQIGAFLPLLLVAGILSQLCVHSTDAWEHFGLSFLWGSNWDPSVEDYGALPHVLGTLLTTFLSLFLAIPLSFAVALLITESPEWLNRPLSHCVDLLAAIPSVIYGMWGLFVLVPIMQEYVQPLLTDMFGLIPLPGTAWIWGEDGGGFGFLTAGIILALMVLPYMCAVMRDVFRMTPPMLRESAYGLGCTRMEVTRDVVMRYGIRGILGGIFIGMGRALGETMAVLFVIGNVMDLPSGLFSCGTTIAATLANNFAEATGLQQSALFALGLVLLLMSFSIQLLTRYYLHRVEVVRGETY